MKAALGIAGVQTEVCAWRSRSLVPGAQIDLLISRRDGVINVCEMEYSVKKFAIDAALERSLRNKLWTFAKETSSDKALHLTMVTANGLVHNAHADIVVNELTVDDLFA